MIDIETEAILSLTEAAKAIPPIDGKRPHVSTIFRWMTSGIRGGVKLEHARIGRRIVTSREALQRFVTALSEAPAPTPQPKPTHDRRTRTEAQRRHDLDRAQARLRARGLVV